MPIVYCPDAPILNNPILNAKPTANPVMSIGVAKYNTFPILVNPPKIIVKKPGNALDGFENSITINPKSKPSAIANKVAPKDEAAWVLK